MDTAPVSQRACSYNPEIHPKESLLGKQAKNNPKGSSASSEADLWWWGWPQAAAEDGVIDSNFSICSCLGYAGPPPVFPLQGLVTAPWAADHSQPGWPEEGGGRWVQTHSSLLAESLLYRACSFFPFSKAGPLREQDPFQLCPMRMPDPK